jgi:hypothetical protein
VVEELSAQGADEPLADRVHARRLGGGAQDPGAGGLEGGVERGGEVRSTVADQKLNVLEPLGEAEGEVAGLLHGPRARRARGDPANVHPAGAMLDYTAWIENDRNAEFADLPRPVRYPQVEVLGSMFFEVRTLLRLM